MNRIHGIRDSEAFKHMITFVPASGYGLEECKCVVRKTVQTLSKEELEQMFVDMLLWLKLFYVDMTHMDVRNYGLDWRVDNNTPQMKTLRMVTRDILGDKSDNDVFHEIEDRWHEIYDLQKRFWKECGRE